MQLMIMMTIGSLSCYYLVSTWNMVEHIRATVTMCCRAEQHRTIAEGVLLRAVHRYQHDRNLQIRVKAESMVGEEIVIPDSLRRGLTARSSYQYGSSAILVIATVYDRAGEMVCSIERRLKVL